MVRRFPSGCLGMSSPRRRWYEVLFPSLAVAVCIPPGARLLLRDIPARLASQLEVSSSEEVTFVQRTADAFTHRDGVRFANGREILLQQLECGQQVTVLKLQGEDDATPDNSDWPAALRYQRDTAFLESSGPRARSRSVLGRQHVASADRW